MEISLLQLSLAIGAAMVAGCFVPKKWLPRRMPHDGILHILAFTAICAPLTFWAGQIESAIGIAAILFVFGWLIEIAQTFIPDRHFGWDDLRYNAIGILIGSILGIVGYRLI